MWNTPPPLWNPFHSNEIKCKTLLSKAFAPSLLNLPLIFLELASCPSFDMNTLSRGKVNRLFSPPSQVWLSEMPHQWGRSPIAYNALLNKNKNKKKNTVVEDHKNLVTLKEKKKKKTIEKESESL